jgi:hypothetical protein
LKSQEQIRIESPIRLASAIFLRGRRAITTTASRIPGKRSAE